MDKNEIVMEDQVVVAKFATTTQYGAIGGRTQTHHIERLRSKR
ncbi:MAG: hypothetical protein ACLSX5_03330 [Lachnospiraceae bacterium]